MEGHPRQRYQHVKRLKVIRNQVGYEMGNKEGERIWGKESKDEAQVSNGQVKRDLIKHAKKSGLHPEGNSEPGKGFM